MIIKASHYCKSSIPIIGALELKKKRLAMRQVSYYLTLNLKRNKFTHSVNILDVWFSFLFYCIQYGEIV